MKRRAAAADEPSTAAASPAHGSADLFDSSVAFNADLVRNIPGIRTSQDLYDDLSSDPQDWAVAMAVEGQQRIPTASAAITRPFDYGTVITYALRSGHWQASRFSDATQFGVWYGSLDVETTVYETAWHWSRFVRDSYASENRDIVSERRVFDVRCDAILADLRGKEKRYPELVSRSSYAFCQAVGRTLQTQGLNGLLVQSARCDGINAALFRAERLSNVRDKQFLTYRYNPASDRFRVERTPGRTWLSFAASSLGPLSRRDDSRRGAG